jgi:hypothetical protein
MAGTHWWQGCEVRTKLYIREEGGLRSVAGLSRRYPAARVSAVLGAELAKPRRLSNLLKRNPLSST